MRPPKLCRTIPRLLLFDRSVNNVSDTYVYEFNYGSCCTGCCKDLDQYTPFFLLLHCLLRLGEFIGPFWPTKCNIALKISHFGDFQVQWKFLFVCSKLARWMAKIEILIMYFKALDWISRTSNKPEFLLVANIQHHVVVHCNLRTPLHVLCYNTTKNWRSSPS